MSKNVYIPSNIGIGLLGIAYNLGSDYEIEGARGSHHLMEHLMCKSFDDMLPKLTRLGINHNAYTSNNKIVFHFSGLDESLALVAKEVYDAITSGNYAWSEEGFENEKATVLQEYEDVFNEQVEGTIVNILRKHYRYYDPIGNRADIEKFSYEDSLKSRSLFTNPDMVCQVGIQHLILPENKLVTKLYQNCLAPCFTYSSGVDLEKIPKKKKFLGIFGDGGKTVVGLIHKDPIPKNKINQVAMVVRCLNDGLESPLLQEIRDKNGLSYFSIGDINILFGSGIINFASCTSNNQKNKLRDIYTKFFKGTLSRHISKQRFENCYDGMMITKKICEKLPHEGVMRTVIEDSPFDGLESFTYKDAIGLLEEYFDINNFAEFEY